MSIKSVQQRVGFTFWSDLPMASAPSAHCSARASRDEEAPPDPQSALEIEPPRLPTRSGTSKLFMLFVCLLCLSFVAWLFAAMLVLPTVHSRRVQQADAREPVRPLPAILKRFTTVRRAQPPLRGADPRLLRTAFPNWVADDQSWLVDEVVRDLALAVTAIALRLEPRPSSTDLEKSLHDRELDL
tara:strand:- start:744 stop:1298 length:555 start_codon:yes stop_codon:yes gene_type:complete